MTNNDTKLKDEIMQELWETKDYYSLSCNSSFTELVRKIREDIQFLDIEQVPKNLSKSYVTN